MLICHPAISGRGKSACWASLHRVSTSRATPTVRWNDVTEQRRQRVLTRRVSWRREGASHHGRESVRGAIVALFCLLLVVAAVALWMSSGSGEDHPPKDESTRDGREPR